jgi:Tol biopolymer transport system component/DNA-binding winged helix-turn-helix (wHTH) protein
MSGTVPPSYEFGSFRLDVAEHMLLHDGHPVPLTPKHFDLLRVLVQNCGHLVEKERLLQAIWPDSFVEEGALNRSVSVLRKILSEDPDGRKYIETVPKRGYRFVATVVESLHTTAPAAPPASRIEIGTIDARSHERAHPSDTPLSPGRVLLRWTATAGAIITVVALSYAALVRIESTAPIPPSFAATHRQVTFTGKEGDPSLSPDGRRIAYVSGGTPEKRVMVQELAGGSPLSIFTAPEAGHLRWSPDGTELMIWARGAGRNGLYIMSQLGGTPQSIGAGLFTGCWSPDGATLAVATNLAGQIRLVNKQGHEQRTLSLHGVHFAMWDIDWSPAAGLLMFVSSDYEGRFTLWTIRADGSEQTMVLTETAEIHAARWAPHGDAIYYLRRMNQTDALMKVRVQPGRHNSDTAVTTLVTGLETDQSFAVSRDGGRLVYARAPYHSNLFKLQLGRGPRTATTPLTHGTSLIERPRVSPDGRSIVFNMGHEPRTDLYTLPITGGQPKQLTFLESFSVAGVWSGDGRSIAFASTQGDKPQVWLVNANGGTPRALSSHELSDSFDLAWSPGSHILYQQPGNRDYYQLDPETGAERLSARDSSVGWMFSPSYSPDGRKIAVMWNRRPNRGIWVIATHTREEALVYTTASPSTMPIGWSADGTAIYVVEGSNAAYRGRTLPIAETLTAAKILMVPVRGGEVKIIAVLPTDEIGGVSMTPDGRTFVYTAYSARSDVWVTDTFDVPAEPRTTRSYWTDMLAVVTAATATGVPFWLSKIVAR